MSIELNEARKQLDILEECAKNPQFILTKLFKNRVSGINFLTQVNIEGRYVYHYLIDYLKTLSVFDNCELQCSSYDLKIYVKHLTHYKSIVDSFNDMILLVDMDSKKYYVQNSCIEDYINKMKEINEIEYETLELTEFWKQFENLTLKKRIKNSFHSLSSSKKLHIRISDFFFHLFVSKNKVETKLEKEKEKLEKSNTSIIKRYEKDIASQKFYKENAPAQIELIKKKQKEIIDYLKTLGYEEDFEED